MTFLQNCEMFSEKFIQVDLTLDDDDGGLVLVNNKKYFYKLF